MPRPAFEGLEPYDGNLSRTVLRGLGARNGPRLPGVWTSSLLLDSLNLSRQMQNLTGGMDLIYSPVCVVLNIYTFFDKDN